MRESTLELAKEVLLSPLSTFKSLDLATAIFFEHGEEVEQQQKRDELQRELEKIMCLDTIEDALVKEWDKGGK